MRHQIHLAEEPRRNYLPVALTALAVLTIFACDRRSSKETATSQPTQPPVVVEEPVIQETVEPPVVARSCENVTYEDAESVFRERKYGEATEMFAAYVTRRPTNPWGHYMLGLSAWKSGELPRARAAFERSLELDPTHVKSLLNLSRVLLEQRETREAADRLGQALALDSTSADVHRLLGRTQASLGDTTGAIASYRTAIRIDRTDVWSMNNLGLLFLRMKRYDDALPPLARAVQLDSTNAVFRNNFGMALEHTGHFVAAADSYRAALAIDSGYVKAKASLVRLDGRTDDPSALPIDIAMLAEDFVSAIEP